jgi:hypothetical protein
MRFYLVDLVLHQALLNLFGHVYNVSLPLVITVLKHASVDEDLL